MSKKVKTTLLTLLAMLLWGSIFPCIKVGYKVFKISSAAEILLFAGIRFLVCGMIITVISRAMGQKADKNTKNSIIPILLTGLFAVVLHYAFTYAGLAVTDSSKTAMLKQLGVLLYICLAFLFVKDESFSVKNIIGGLIGFLGIAVMNVSNGRLKFSAGEILIFLASVCTVVSNLTCKKALKTNSAFIVTGISQLFGGVVLTAAGVVLGAEIGAVTPVSAAVFAYICIASIIGYCLWYHIVGTNTLSWLFLIKFAEPVFAGVFGWLILGEDIFNIRYLAAVVLIGTGIVIGSMQKKRTGSL